MVHWDVMYVMYVVDLGTPGSLIMMVMSLELAILLQGVPVQLDILGGVVIMMIVAIVIIMN